MDEISLRKHIFEIAKKNKELNIFRGAGSYNVYVPSIIKPIVLSVFNLKDLEKNPVTKSAVQEIGGVKTVDTKEMTMANSAVLAEVCRRLENIEKKLGVE